MECFIEEESLGLKSDRWEGAVNKGLETERKEQGSEGRILLNFREAILHMGCPLELLIFSFFKKHFY